MSQIFEVKVLDTESKSVIHSEDVVADTSEQAKLKCVKEHGSEFDLDKVQILVRPFAGN